MSPVTWLQRALSPKKAPLRVRPIIPRGERVYAIGDIHGRLDLLEDLLVQINIDCAGYNGLTTLIFLGDYVDRGPHSAQVIERLVNLPDKAQQKAVFLLGNHEQVLLDFLAQVPGSYHWLRYGGIQTLNSYGVLCESADVSSNTLAEIRQNFKAALPAKHLKFLRTLQQSYDAGDYFFCHAGVRPGIPLAAQSMDDLIWMREPFLSSYADFGKVVVHGHSITDTPSLRPNHIGPNRIGIDTGAFATGRLTAVVLEGESRRFLST